MKGHLHDAIRNAEQALKKNDMPGKDGFILFNNRKPKKTNILIGDVDSTGNNKLSQNK